MNDSAPKPRYRLGELLAQCDGSAAISPEDREWLDACLVGRELDGATIAAMREAFRRDALNPLQVLEEFCNVVEAASESATAADWPQLHAIYARAVAVLVDAGWRSGGEGVTDDEAAQDMADASSADEVMQAIRSGRESPVPLEDVMRRYGMEAGLWPKKSEE